MEGEHCVKIFFLCCAQCEAPCTWFEKYIIPNDMQAESDLDKVDVFGAHGPLQRSATQLCRRFGTSEYVQRLAVDKLNLVPQVQS